MKGEIKLTDGIYKYNIIETDCDEISCNFQTTYFYKDAKTTWRKRFYIFGKLIKVQKPNYLFKVETDIENVKFTKKEIRKMIYQSYAKYLRQLEIEKGEII